LNGSSVVANNGESSQKVGEKNRGHNLPPEDRREMRPTPGVARKPLAQRIRLVDEKSGKPLIPYTTIDQATFALLPLLEKEPRNTQKKGGVKPVKGGHGGERRKKFRLLRTKREFQPEQQKSNKNYREKNRNA